MAKFGWPLKFQKRERLIKVGDIFQAPGLSSCSLCRDDRYNLAYDIIIHVPGAVKHLKPAENSDHGRQEVEFSVIQEYIAVEAYMTPKHLDSYRDEWPEAWTVVCVPKGEDDTRIRFYQTGAFKYTRTNIKFLK